MNRLKTTRWVNLFFLCIVLVVSITIIKVMVVRATVVNMNNEIVHINVNGIDYVNGSSERIQVLTGEVFPFKVVLKNTGTNTWGRYTAEGQHGASLLSRGDASHDIDDYNETFGTFFIFSDGRHLQTTPPEDDIIFDTFLKAPDISGNYTMRWQMADYPVAAESGSHISSTGSSYDNPINYFHRTFFGRQIVINIEVNERTERQPAPVRKEGVLDQFDFAYEGSFTLPQVWSGNGTKGFQDNKVYVNSGIALRKVQNEQGQKETRLLAVTGTYANSLYEMMAPETLGKIIGTDISGVPAARLIKNFEGQSNLKIAESNRISETWAQGSMWFDAETDILYWTNIPTYLAGSSLPTDCPSAWYAKLDFENGLVYDRKEWYRNSWDNAPRSSFFQGVTAIPKSLSNYFGGRKLAFGFGGGPSVNNCSFGPTLAAVSVDESGNIQNDFLPIMYYGNMSQSGDFAIRDGNYFDLKTWGIVPQSPWEGKWTSTDYGRSGILIDYGGKKGYIVFASQSIGRLGYETGGSNWFAKPQQQAWYFYSIDDLNAAIKNGTPMDITPSSFSVMDLPSGNLSNDSTDAAQGYPRITGSSFDNEDGLLYLYVNGREPYVHVYKVIEGESFAPSINGGLSAMSLKYGYQATSTSAFTISGSPVPTVTKTGGNIAVAWNDSTKKLDIAAGLSTGVYPVTITATNEYGTAMFTFTLTVQGADGVDHNSGDTSKKSASNTCGLGIVLPIVGFGYLVSRKSCVNRPR